MKTDFSSACNGPVQLVLLDIHSEELNVIKVVGEEVDGVHAIHIR